MAQMALVLNWIIRINLNHLVENSASQDFELVKNRVYEFILSLFGNEIYMVFNIY